MDPASYLTNLPSDICNATGLSKTLLTRRETIRLKHLQKTLFVYRKFDDDELLSMLEMLQFKGLMQYFEFHANRLRGIYKFSREFAFDNADKIVKEDDTSFIDMLRMYKTAKPIVVLDFDKTITNKRFHSLYRWLTDEKLCIVINSANPDLETIKAYLDKNGLPRPARIFNNKGKKQKLVSLKALAVKEYIRPMFYVDDELEYLQYANLLFYRAYLYTKQGKILYRSLNIR